MKTYPPRSVGRSTPVANDAPAPAVLVTVAHGSAGRPRKAMVLGTQAAADVLGEIADGGPVSAVDAAALDGQLIERMQEERPDDVYLELGGDLDEEVIARAGARALMDGAELHLVLPGGARPPVRTRTERIGSHTMISVRAVSDGVYGRAVRRTVDVLAATTLLIAFAPLFALVALLVRWKLGRPVLFAQERLGRSERRFQLLKFRSMVDGAEELLRQSPDLYRIYVASNFKLPENIDPRITPLGRFLRRTSLDELPQLLNVLRGDMTLVGPRPIVPEELAKYGEYGRMLLRVKPGLTGQWQVNGRSGVGYPERARIDLAYLAQRNLYQDLRLLLLTVPAVLKRRGAT